MADPVLNTEVVTTTLKRLLWQFRGQPNIEAVLTSYLEQAQEIEQMFIDLLILRRLENAEGAQLDGMGSIVGELRLGKDDTDYRAAIFGRIKLNLGNSKVEEILFLFVLLLGAGFPLEMIEGQTASFTLYINAALGGVGVPSPALLAAQLKKAKGGGIRGDLVYALVDKDLSFTYASGDVPEADALRGHADDGQTTGGYYVDVAT